MKTFIGWARKQMGDCPPTMEPRIPSAMVQKIVRCMCMTDLAITPAIKPTKMYQIK